MLAFQIISEWFLWFLIILIPFIVLSVWYFYRKDDNLAEIPKKILIFVKSLRTAVLIILTLILLSIIFKWNKNHIKKPIVVVDFVQSQSIALSSKFKEQKDKIASFIKTLKTIEDFDYKFIGFGSDINPNNSLTFNQKTTDISSVIDYIHQQYEFENLGAIVLLSDGIYNQRPNPLYINHLTSTPIFSVCLGDTATYSDLIIDRINYNSKVYLGNNIKINVAVKANKLRGKNQRFIWFTKEKSSNLKTLL